VKLVDLDLLDVRQGLVVLRVAEGGHQNSTNCTASSRTRGRQRRRVAGRSAERGRRRRAKRPRVSRRSRSGYRRRAVTFMAVPDEGFDFLGYHFRRQRKKGTSKYYAYTKPSKKAIQAIKDKVKVKTYRSTRNQDLDELITSLNQTLVGWALYSGTECPRPSSTRSTTTRGTDSCGGYRQVQGQEIPTRNA
jgi:hypothetical protein